MEQPRNYYRGFYKSYPYLTKSEFAEVCHYLDRKYTQATLGPKRKEWRLDIHVSLDTSGGPGVVTFLQITRSLEDKVVEHDLASLVDNFDLGPPTRRSTRFKEKPPAPAEQMLIDSEDSDQVVVQRPRRTATKIKHVVYEVHLHPTYQVPCLWFSLHHLPVDEDPMDVESVFRHLVPQQYRDALRGAGAIGGISIDHHPLTGVPTFFVHPCLVGEAMTNFDCAKEDYLMIWLGQVGGCVGLSVPMEMAIKNEA
ncbi:hypothetical protein F5Y15DRAFT_394556 [Xylariaceae sp. FL0016]|nr:hypothetical protein F5Y15DRAFT_394556 [Xylariaceae sp. FL0016]